MSGVRPMSDRRFVVVLVALLVAAVGALVGGAALLELGDPVSASGETGALVDLTAELVALVAVCGLLVLAGAGTAVLLVRAQLRA